MLLVVLVLLITAHIAFTEIYDPLNVFCGSTSCYEVLKIPRNATAKEIKKAFRDIGKTMHPDKNREKNATEVFRIYSKAFEVLTGNESKALFDYYLDHPRDYFTVSGEHYMRDVPFSDVRVVLLGTCLLISWFFHVLQQQKYDKAVKFLKNASLNNLGMKGGGTKQTLELHRRATELYEAQLKEKSGKLAKAATSKGKLAKDPVFQKCVDEVVAEVKIEGGYRKPGFDDLFIVQVGRLPYTTYLWGMKYHRRYISKTPLPIEEQIEMAREMVGLATWEELTEAEKTKLLEKKIWLHSVYDSWKTEKVAEMEKKVARKMGRRHRRSAQDDEDETDPDYIE